MNQVFDRVRKILLSPKDALEEVKAEELDVARFMKEYVAIVAAVTPVAMFIGLLGFRMNFIRSLFFSALVYLIGLAGVFVFGKIIDSLAPTFNATKDDLSAFKLSAYAYTPFFIAGIAYINPGLGFLSLVGALYGIYILYLGMSTLMASPQEKTIPYAAVAIILNAVVMFILWVIAETITGVGTGRFVRPW